VNSNIIWCAHRWVRQSILSLAIKKNPFKIGMLSNNLKSLTASSCSPVEGISRNSFVLQIFIYIRWFFNRSFYRMNNISVDVGVAISSEVGVIRADRVENQRLPRRRHSIASSRSVLRFPAPIPIQPNNFPFC